MSISALYPFQSVWSLSSVPIAASGSAVVFSTVSATNPIGMYLVVVDENPGDAIITQGPGSQVQLMLNLNRTGATHVFEQGWVVGTLYANSSAIPANVIGVVFGTNNITVFNNNTTEAAQVNVVVYKLL